jgi:TIR domain-containing protein
MGVDSLNRVGAQTGGAVFLSYASQDTDAAQRICAALQAAGIEVWFDQSELRGSDSSGR